MPFWGTPVTPPVSGTISDQSSLSPAWETKGKEVTFSSVKLTDLPGAMDNMGWIHASKLMTKWFLSKAYILTNEAVEEINEEKEISTERCDETTITMEWACSYPRVARVRDHLKAHWLNFKVADLIRKKLQNAGYPSVFGEKASARILHKTTQVQRKNFGDLLDTLDDMYGALGNAAFYLAVIGECDKDIITHSGRGIFTVTDIGIYIRDIYEFNGFQFLGIWTKKRTYGKAEIINTVSKSSGVSAANVAINYIREPFSAVFNSDFRRYREKYGFGGDFFIFSDVEWTSVPYGSIQIPLCIPMNGRK